jgi:hypothetical protein
MDDFEFTSFQEKCLDLVRNSDSTCRGRFSILNAVRHLRKGWALRDIDPEMAAFRGLTAEEEAVTGVFWALQHRNYTHAERLKPHDHVQKNAAIPFLQALALFFEQFSETKRANPKLHIKEEQGARRLMLMLTAHVDGKDVAAYPMPPLNFGVTMNGERPSFASQINTFLASQNSHNILDFVRGQANLRNQVLYASPAGCPTLTSLEGRFFEVRRARVMAMATAYLFIEPWQERQPFVQHALDAFLVMLKKLNNEVLRGNV